MATINIDDIQRDWSQLLKRVEQGEAFVILRANHPVAQLTPVGSAAAGDGRRPFGLAKGDFVVPDDFNEPDPETEEAFGGL